jgi:hypothetical protein
MGETRNANRVLVGKAEGKIPLGRPRRRWVDNIKIDLRERGWDGMDWIDVAQDRDQWKALVNMALSFQVPSSVGKFLNNCTTGGFRIRALLHVVC